MRTTILGRKGGCPCIQPAARRTVSDREFCARPAGNKYFRSLLGRYLYLSQVCQSETRGQDENEPRASRLSHVQSVNRPKTHHVLLSLRPQVVEAAVILDSQRQLWTDAGSIRSHYACRFGSPIPLPYGHCSYVMIQPYGNFEVQGDVAAMSTFYIIHHGFLHLMQGFVMGTASMLQVGC